MNRWIVALPDVEKALSKNKGEFALFACYLPAEYSDLWDLVVAAPWARRDERAAVDLIGKSIATKLSLEERLLISRIVVVEPSHPDVQRVNAMFDVEHKLVEIANEDHFGYLIQRGVIITSKDYWRFIKQLFPRHAEFVFFTRDWDLHIRVSWTLNDDPERPNKKSRNIILKISHEVLDDYLYVDDPRRHEAEQKLVDFVSSRLESFNPNHDTPRHMTTPREEWRVTTALFQRHAAALA
jgi:hypothetical protein